MSQMSNSKENLVVTRFAPSPTGTLHMGGVRTALFNYLFTKQRNGKSILRIDDTDKTRSTKEFEQDIIKGLAWLGLDYGETYHQSERLGIYQKYLTKLVEENKIYISKEVVEKEGDRTEVIRFRNPNKKVKFTDLIKGEIEFDTTELGDFVVAKDLKTPLYHFASVVDDYEMGITHIIRGEDHISNTPRQILMWEAIGATLPEFAHLPMILAPDRTKLSKRRHASIASLNGFIENGYISQAVVNFVALLGWSPQSIHDKETVVDTEILSLDELINLFDISKVQKSGAIFNIQKLNWLNKEYIKLLPPVKLGEEVLLWLKNSVSDYDEKIASRLVPVIADRINYFGQIKQIAEEGELDYFFTAPKYNKILLKNTAFLGETMDLLKNIPAEQFTAEQIKTVLWDFATAKGRGEVLWPMRIALSGKEKSPDPFTLAATLGKTETLARLTHAQNL